MAEVFCSLQHHNFRLYYAGQSVSLIGTWMQRLAVSWLVYNAARSAFLLGLVSFCGQIPTLMLFIAGTNTSIQTNVDDHMRGHVLSYYVMAFQGIQPLGALLVGWLARHIGAPHTVVLQGTLGLLVGLAFWQQGRPQAEKKKFVAAGN